MAIPNSTREAQSSTTSAAGDPRLKRRSSRLTIQIPVEVISKGPQNNVRSDETKTLVVSAHGCAITLNDPVLAGEKLVVIHKMSREEMICRVVVCRQGKGGLWEIGLEFQRPSPMFWHIAFPPDDWDGAELDSPAPAKK